MTTILVVDDSAAARNRMVEALDREYGSMIDVRQISTESEFRQWIDHDVEEVPSLVVLDMMLRWADVTPDRPPMPKEVADNGYYRAGLRCLRLLRADPRTERVPVILHTVLAWDDVAGDLERSGTVFFRQKVARLGDLIGLCTALLHAGGSLVQAVDSKGGVAPRTLVCRRGHLVPVGSATGSGGEQRFCPKCGAPIVASCDNCGSAVASDAGASVRPSPFCTRCGAPLPWATTGELILHLENLLQYEPLDEATQLLLIEEIAVLGTYRDTVDDERKIQAATLLRHLAPRVWELGRPVLSSLLTSAAKQHMGI